IDISRPMSLGADSIGNIWIGMTDIGLLRFDGNTWTTFNDSNSPLSTNRIRCITYDKKSKNLWAGNILDNGKGDGGCAVFDGVNWKAYSGIDMGYGGF